MLACSRAKSIKIGREQDVAENNAQGRGRRRCRRLICPSRRRARSPQDGDLHPHDRGRVQCRRPQLAAAIKLYAQQHGDVVAGRKIELIMRDDGGVADAARRIVQEMIVNDKVGLVA
jgi:hypothetical protein